MWWLIGEGTGYREEGGWTGQEDLRGATTKVL